MRAVKVPVIMQMETLECGAASLAMILAYHGKWLPLEQVRYDCDVSRDGSSAKKLLQAARNYGLNAKGYRMELDALRTATLPCILHWEFNHFVVLCGFSGSKAVINDPSRGRVLIPLEELDNSFTGICLQFEKKPDFQPEGGPKSIWKFAKTRLTSLTIPVIFVCFTGVVLAVGGILSPVFARVFTDHILSGESPDWLEPLLALMLVFVIIDVLVSWVKQKYFLLIRAKLDVTSSSSFFWHVLHLPMSFFSQRMVGDISQRQSENFHVASTLIVTLAPTLLDFALLIVYLVVMFNYSIPLTLVGILGVLVNLLLSLYISKKRINITRREMRDEGRLAGTTVSAIAMIETIKASGAENGVFERWAGCSAAVNAAESDYVRLQQSIAVLPNLVTGIVNLGILGVGIWQILQGKFTVGMLLAFQGFLRSFLAPAKSILTSVQSLQEMRTSMERVEDVMNYPADVQAVDTLPDDCQKLTGALSIRNVTFGYSRLSKPLIENFSLELKAGQSVAIVGGSGSGKSTIAQLISGLYTPWSGEILFDGRPIIEIPRPVFTGSVAVVNQDIVLFCDTVGENIRLWDGAIEDFEVILAARDASMHSDIMSREGGYSAAVSENGKNFSGGQRQRLEIARVLACDPTLLILDEATSALDAKMEMNVVQAIRTRGITSVVIAHRLSTVRDCDEILVLQDGAVTERGTHDELMALQGHYADLISME